MLKSKSFQTMVAILIVSLGCVLLSVDDGIGQQYPNRPITIILPFGTGGSTDVLTRSMMVVAEKKLGVPLIISNRPGAEGVIGLTELARSKPDGYTLGTIGTGSSVVAPLMRAVAYDSMKDFDYICGFTSYTYGIFTKTGSRFKTLQDVVKEARTNPGKITYGSMSLNASLGLKKVDLKESTKMTYVPFPSGAQAAASLIGGHIDIAILSTDANKFLNSKDIIMLASAASKRWSMLPDVPTMIELGYDIDLTAWTSMGAPAGVAKAQLNILNEAFKAAHADPGVKKIHEDLNARAPYTSGEEIKKFYASRHDEYKPLVEIIKAEQKMKK